MKAATPDMRKLEALTQPTLTKGVAMTDSDIKKTFSLTCPKCGNDQFVQNGKENLESEITCPSCGAMFVARDRANDQAGVEAAQVAQDLAASGLADVFKKFGK